MTRLVAHLDLIKEILSTGYKEMHDHLMEENYAVKEPDPNEINEDVCGLVPIFASLLITTFISDLQDHTPNIATHIFDCFLIDGEKVVFTLLMKFMQM